MNKYRPGFIVENMLDRLDGMPINSAPDKVRVAIADAETALIDNLNAASEVDDADLLLPHAERLWEQAAEIAVRAQEPLPNRDIVERATITARVRRADAFAAERRLESTVNTVASLLASNITRTAWRTDVETRVTELRTEINTAATAIESQVRELANLVGFTTYLGEYGDHAWIPQVEVIDPITALRNLANAPTWKDPERIDDTPRFQGNPADDKRPTVWIVNYGGTVHSATAAHADTMLTDPGFRLASPDEIAQWHKRQGLTAPAAT